MDGIEVARRMAASIHADALARGVDPWSPLDLVLAEVERAGFAAEAIEPGAVQLDGALAKFLPDIGLILYSDVESAFERAFLVAHELGHALLGDAVDLCEVQPDRHTEDAADGEELVIAHGPRQRREIQMDLFARELLLPRPFARECHLVENLGAAQIAERLGAPYDVVAQQLLDALLVPVAPSDKSRPARKLNPAQRDAAEHFGGPYLLEAGPGTGKTEALVGRVAWLLSHKQILPRNILVLTYSNNGATELSERIAGGNAEALAEMWIGTFHAFGRDLLHVFGDRVGRTRTPSFLDRVGGIDLLEHELSSLNLQHFGDLYDPTAQLNQALAAISRAQDEMCGPDAYHRLATDQLAHARELPEDVEGQRDAAIEAGEIALDIAVIYRRYDALKRERALVDFGDYVMLATELLEQHQEARDYAKRYTQVLVDEYQDVNQASVRLLKALCPGGVGLWAVGDARQSIYRFRGASSRNMARFRLDFPAATGGGLVLNYRSRPEIVKLVSHFGAGMMRIAGQGDPAVRDYDELGTTRGNCGVKPELIIFPETAKEAPALAEVIKESVAGEMHYRDHCVLVSGNDRLARIAKELEALGVPVLFLGSLFERPEVKDLLNLLSLLTDRGASGLLRTACHPDFPMRLEDVVLFLRAQRETPASSADWISMPQPFAEQLSPEGATSLIALANALGPLDRAAYPSRILAELLLDRTKMAARLASSDDVSGVTAAIATWQLVNFARAQRGDTGRSIERLIARVRRLLQLEEGRELRQLPAAAQRIDAVRLMTIHGAKGLEFGTVHLLGLNDNTLPKPDRSKGFVAPEGMIAHPRGTLAEELEASHREEQDCLLYVALSRAKERLHLYRANCDAKGKLRGQSSFIPRLAPPLISRSHTPVLVIPVPQNKQPIPVTLPANWRVPAWQVDTYNRCQRRFLYVHLLGTGGVQHKRALRHLHDAVHKVCNDLTARDSLPAQADIDVMLAEACAHPAIAEHGNADGLRELARQLVARYCAAGEGMTRLDNQSFETSFHGDVVFASPHEILEGPDGKIIRMLKTGHRRDKDADSLDARTIGVTAALRLPGSQVEFLYLADHEPRVTFTLKRAAPTNLDKAVAKALQGIRAGEFATAPRAPTCALCPALLLCDPVPPGALDLSVPST